MKHTENNHFLDSDRSRCPVTRTQTIFAKLVCCIRFLSVSFSRVCCNIIRYEAMYGPVCRTLPSGFFEPLAPVLTGEGEYRSTFVYVENGKRSKHAMSHRSAPKMANCPNMLVKMLVCSVKSVSPSLRGTRRIPPRAPLSRRHSSLRAQQYLRWFGISTKARPVYTADFISLETH